jgi:hypothetical protein
MLVWGKSESRGALTPSIQVLRLAQERRWCTYLLRISHPSLSRSSGAFPFNRGVVGLRIPNITPAAPPCITPVLPGSRVSHPT